ncbi:unnamed protein product [Diatraea saccharalis]|uniref:Uncharacterized protein n=1 Tax=Diatraea saccharalis TaxID=40085 RepID=A0A9P0C2K6_9NEOP|nr:unnamed protein product [Diatraea saccharalis]
MERAKLGVSLRDRIRNEEIQARCRGDRRRCSLQSNIANLVKAAASTCQIKCDRSAQWTCFGTHLGERHQRHRLHDITMKILSIVVLLALVAYKADAAPRPQDDAEPRSPSRGLLKRGLKGKPTTTTTTAAPQEEVEYEDDVDYSAEAQQEPSTEAPPSSTEGKKLVAGGVRPFRSNTDLLETLKRRRAQAAEQSKHGHSAAAQAHESPAADTASKGKKRFNNPPPARENNNEEAPAPAKPSRGRFGRRKFITSVHLSLNSE